ncbi:MAG: hypothetical protein ABMB14_19700 [Myxococcota bacterium]
MRFCLLVALAACVTVDPTSSEDTSTAPSTPSTPSTTEPTDPTTTTTTTADSGTVPIAPGLGAHTLAYYGYGAGISTTLTTDPIDTRASGSTLVVSVGRGDLSAAVLPTDSAGNAWLQLGTEHVYTLWPSSGTAVYAAPSAVGGAGLTVSVTAPLSDETTLAMVEVTGGGQVTDVAWSEITSGPLTSDSVTTTGPATLVAFWWGDADGSVGHTATPDGGFTVTDALLDAGSLVQCAAAVKTVDAAGTYDVTWTATPTQGAQLWLVAVE